MINNIVIYLYGLISSFTEYNITLHSIDVTTK
jgi:hypothetical protein